MCPGMRKASLCGGVGESLSDCQGWGIERAEEFNLQLVSSEGLCLGGQSICNTACVGALEWRVKRSPHLYRKLWVPTWGGGQQGQKDVARILSSLSFHVWSSFCCKVVYVWIADLSLPENLQEYFQGLESHMILTETLFRKIISFAVLQEMQFHTELMAQASAVLKRAHKRGVELEYILEVRLLT